MKELDVKSFTTEEMTFFQKNHYDISDLFRKEIMTRIKENLPKDILEEYIALRKGKKIEVYPPTEVTFSTRTGFSDQKLIPEYYRPWCTLDNIPYYKETNKEWKERVNKWNQTIEDWATKHNFPKTDVFDVLYNMMKNREEKEKENA